MMFIRSVSAYESFIFYNEECPGINVVLPSLFDPIYMSKRSFYRADISIFQPQKSPCLKISTLNIHIFQRGPSIRIFLILLIITDNDI